jgi:hypothetical protein
MKLVQSIILGAAVFSLAAGSAVAADKPTKERTTVGNVGAATRSDESGFAKLDKNNDGYISREEAAADPALAKDFAKFDLNNDGKLNRAEYLAASAKEDVSSAANKVKEKAKEPAASSGSSTTPSSATPK